MTLTAPYASPYFAPHDESGGIGFSFAATEEVTVKKQDQAVNPKLTTFRILKSVLTKHMGWGNWCNRLLGTSGLVVTPLAIGGAYASMTLANGVLIPLAAVKDFSAVFYLTVIQWLPLAAAYVAADVASYNFAAKLANNIRNAEATEAIAKGFDRRVLQNIRALMRAAGIDNRPQRVHEDPKWMAQHAMDFMLDVSINAMKALSFTGALYLATKIPSAEEAKANITEVPGDPFTTLLMVASCAAIAAGLSYGAHRTAKKTGLQRLSYEQQALDGDLRELLIWADKVSEQLALGKGGEFANKFANSLLEKIYDNQKKTIWGRTWARIFDFFKFEGSVGVLSLILIGLIVSGQLRGEAFFAAAFTMKLLTDAFNRWPEQVWRLAELKADVHRLEENARLNTEAIHRTEAGTDVNISYTVDNLLINASAIPDRSGQPLLKFAPELKDELTFDFGDCIHVSGESGAGKTTFMYRILQSLRSKPDNEFRLIPLGSEALLPPQLKLPRTGRYPTLRELIAFQGEVDDFEEDSFKVALKLVGLEEFENQLDAEVRDNRPGAIWTTSLSKGQKDRLAVAHAALRLKHLHAGQVHVLVLDEALASMGYRQQEAILSGLQTLYQQWNVPYVILHSLHNMHPDLDHLHTGTAHIENGIVNMARHRPSHRSKTAPGIERSPA